MKLTQHHTRGMARRTLLTALGVGALTLGGTSGVLYYRSHTPSHLIGRAWLEFNHGEYVAAIGDLQGALGRHPGEPKAAEARNLLGRTLIAAGRAEDARQYLEESLRRNPQDTIALDLLLQTYYQPVFARFLAAPKPLTQDAAQGLLQAIKESLPRVAAMEKQYPQSPFPLICQAQHDYLAAAIYADQVRQANAELQSAQTSGEPLRLAHAKAWLAAFPQPVEAMQQRVIDDLHAALQRDPKCLTAAELLQQFHAEQGQFAQAAAVAREMIQRQTVSERLIVTAGRAIRQNTRELPDPAARQTQAQQLLEQFVAQHDPAPHARAELGDLLLERGDLAGAEQQAQKVLATRKDDLNATLLLAQIRLRQDRAADAKRLVTALTPSYQQVPQVWFTLGQANTVAGDLAAAQENYKKVLALVPGYSPAKRAVFVNQVRLKDPAAELAAADLLREDPYFMPAWSLSVETLLQQGKAEQARQRLLQLASDPKLPEANKPDTIRLLGAVGLWDAANTLLASLPNTLANQATHLQLQALIQLGRDNLPEARRLLGAAVAADPANFDARMQLAEVLNRSQLRGDARTQLDAAQPLAKEPDQFLRLARSYLAMEMFSQASTLASRALTLRPTDHDAVALKTEAEAKAKGMPYVPEPSVAGRSLGDTLRLADAALQRKDFSQAATLLRAAPDADTLPVLWRLAQAYQGMGLTTDAWQSLEKACKLAPQEPLTFDLLVALYGTKESAATGLEKARVLATLNPAMSQWAIGSLQNVQGHPEAARAAFEAGLKALPRDAANQTAVREHLYTGLLAAAANARDDAALLREVDRVAGDPGFAALARLSAATYYLSTQRPDAARGQLLKFTDAAAGQKIAPERWRQVAQSWLELGDADAALAVLDRLPAEVQASERMQSLRLQVLHQSGRFAEAAALGQQLATRDPLNTALLGQLAGLQAQAHEYPAAFATLAKLEAQAGSNRSALLLAAQQRTRLYLLLGLHDAAAQQWEQATRLLQPDDHATALQLAELSVQLRRYPQARTLLERIPPAATVHGSAQILLAAVESEQGQYDAAIRRLQARTSDAVRDPNAIEPLVRVLLRAGKAEEALHVALEQRDRYAAMGASGAKWQRLAATAAREAGKLDQAAELLTGLAKREPADLTDVVRLRLMQGKQTEARAAADGLPADAAGELALQLLAAPEKTTTLLDAHAGALDNAPAAVIFAVLAATPPEQWPTLAKGPLAAGTLTGGDWAALQQEFATQPKARQVLRQLALAEALREADWLTAARRELDVAKSASPASPWVSLIRYRIQAAGHEIAAATQTLKELQTQAPNLPAGRLAVAYEALRQGDAAAALRAVEPVAQAEPKRLVVQMMLAEACEKLGQSDRAIALNRQALAEHPDALEPANNLAYLLAQTRPQDAAALKEAKERIDWALRRSPGTIALRDTQAWVLFRGGQNDAAYRALAEAMVALRDNPAVHYHMGMIYQAQGQAALARLHLANVAALAGDRTDVPEVALARQTLQGLQNQAVTADH